MPADQVPSEADDKRNQAARDVLKEAGCREFKILEEDDIVRLYVHPRDLILFLDERKLENVVNGLMDLGYNFITIGTLKTFSIGKNYG